jgi:hypothetical protein
MLEIPKSSAASIVEDLKNVRRIRDDCSGSSLWSRYIIDNDERSRVTLEAN